MTITGFKRSFVARAAVSEAVPAVSLTRPVFPVVLSMPCLDEEVKSLAKLNRLLSLMPGLRYW